MSLYTSFRSELFKIRRSSSIYLTLLAAAIIPFTSFLETSLEGWDAKIESDPWNKFLFEGFEGLSILILPMYIILLCTIPPQLEYKNGTWKQVLTSPQKKIHVFLSRFLVVQFMLIGFFITYNLLMMVAALMVHAVVPGPDFFADGVNWGGLLQVNGTVYVSVLAISVVQFWLGLRLKNFIAPIAIGFCLWVAAGMMIFEFHITAAKFFPFAFPIVSTFSKYASDIPMLAWTSVAYTVLFMVMAYWDFSVRKLKW